MDSADARRLLERVGRSMMINMIQKNLVQKFFPFPDFRPHQQECIQKAISALYEQDYDLFIIDAPVGFGKSPVHVGIANLINHMFDKRCFYTTPQIILQNQLVKDFGEKVPQIKGKRNYDCIEDLYLHPFSPVKLKCDVGSCQDDLEKNKEPNCKFYPEPIKDPFTGKRTNILCDSDCPYFHARYIGMTSPICGANVSYLARARFLGNRGLIIVDEAHNVPELLINDLAIKITRQSIKEESWIPVTNPPFEKYPFERWIEWLEFTLLPAITDRIEEIDKRIEELRPFIFRDNPLDEDRVEYIHLKYEMNNLDGNKNKVMKLLNDYVTFHEEWAIDHNKDKSGNEYVQLTPITSARFLTERLWSRGDKIIIASGTIVPNYFLSEAGLEEKSFDSKDCVFSIGSSFPPQRSPIYYIPIGKMSYEYKETVRPLIMQEINRCIAQRRDRRGIIHTFNYENAKYIKEHIADDLRHLLVMQKQDARDKSLKSWLEDPRQASVFVSTAMTEGIDLRDDLCRYQIYMKIGYLDLKNPRVNKRLKDRGDNIWYAYQAIEDVEQASGRSTRSKEDWSEMFIFDECFGNLIKYNMLRVLYTRSILYSGSVSGLPRNRLRDGMPDLPRN